MIPLLLYITKTFSVEEILMDFGYTYAPNLIHQGASVITVKFHQHMVTRKKGQKLYKLDAFIEVVGLPTTYGSSPKPI
jgi:hypothetical protein